MKTALAIFLSLFLITLHLRAQDTTKYQLDSVIVNEDDVLVFEDSAVSIKKDTLLLIPDSIDFIISKYDSLKTQRFYDSLKTKFYRSQFTKEIYDLLFTRPGKNSNSNKVEDNGKKSESAYLKYKGKIIGDINIHRLAPFGTDVEDTTVHADVWIVETGNKLHINTHSWVIRKGLLFEKGDRLNPLQLADNERLIRELPYIKDARINVIPRKDNSDTVDILLVTKDIWSITFDINARGFISGSLDVDERNILGFGHELDNRLVISPDENQKWGYEGTYRIPNIKGSYITGEVNFADVYNKEAFGVNFFRGFITPETKYAGGLELSNRRVIEDRRFENDSIIFDLPVEFNLQDMWVGRSFPVRLGDQSPKRSRIVVAGRIARKNFNDRPLVEIDTNRAFHNATLALVSLGYSTREYYKARFINSFGRTEDIPVGSMAEITAGKEYGEFSDRFYTGVRLAKGTYIADKGYYFGEIKVGGFFNNKRFEQGVFNIGINYFSNLVHFNRYSLRQFLKVKYTLGIRRFSDESLNINNDNGIRGLNSEFLRGTRKLVFNVETVVFTPFNPVGFRIAVFGFADLGLISMNKAVFKGDLYSGLGVGIRIRNDNLTFNIFQIRLAFYPRVPPDESRVGVNASGESVLRLNDFDIKSPGAIRLE